MGQDQQADNTNTVSTMTETNEKDTVYNLNPILSPRLVGYQLQLFPKLLRLPLIGDYILNHLKKTNRFDRVTALASTLATQPLYYPLHLMSIEERALHEEMIEASPLSIGDLANLKQNERSFRHWTINDFTSRYKTQEVTPTQVATRIIALVNKTKESNPLIVLMDEEDVLKQAAESTKRYEKGLPKGVLDGVPIAVKDEIDVLGYHTAHGTSFIREHVDADCPPIAKLRDEGAMIVGKTNQHEIGMGTTGYNKFYGPTHNPYNANHYTGGSSSGSAGAVSAGLVPLAIGTDGGGSIRIPSALCGVVGVKPTFKRISADFGSCQSLISIGPIAGSLDDAALAYAIMAGETDYDFRHQSHFQPKVHLHNYINPPQMLDDVRIGFFRSHIEDAEVLMVDNTMKAIEFYQSLGATIVEIELPHLKEIHLSHAITILTEALSASSKYIDTNNKNDYSGEIQTSLEIAKSFSSRDFLDSQKIRSFAMDTIEELFNTKIDIIISPGTASVAPRMQDDVRPQGESHLKLTEELMRYMLIGNFTGIPGIVFPVGYDHDTHLPISIQLQAAHWREDLLFRLAKIGERLLPNGWEKPFGYIGSGLD